MKRVVALIISVGMLLSLTACVVIDVKEETYEEKKELQPTNTQTQPKNTEPEETQPEETEYPVPPELKPLITAFFAEESMQGDVVYFGDETEYAVRLGFTAEVNLDFQFCQLIWETQTYEVSEIFVTDSLASGETFLAYVAFPGDMTTYGITVTDQNGSTQNYAVYISGMDGSLVCREY